MKAGCISQSRSIFTAKLSSRFPSSASRTGIMAPAETTGNVQRPEAGKQSMGSFWTQMFPPKPTYTEEQVPDLTGKIFIVTGSSSGVGKEAARMLYAKNAKVYMAARPGPKLPAAINSVQEAVPKSGGALIPLELDLADLAVVKKAVEKFTSLETKLHGLINNAAVQALKDTDGDARTAQGHEIHMGVNVLAPFLFTRLLTGVLTATARQEPPGTVRVVWVSSMGTETIGEKRRGLSPDYVDYWPLMSPLERYGLSKAGNWLHGVEFARRYAADGIASFPINPGHLKSDLYREGGALFKFALKPVLYPPTYGAYVELFAALSPTLTLKDSGAWIVPWGRLYPIRSDLSDATKTEGEGGNGHARAFWNWSEEQVKVFL
ncbi:short-chain dehydrogenase/reductase sthC [Parastagonospora nodorum]|uniref:Short-chain dehydrogenase/reductase sthC n=1 Tax=Phaeosphaeria nodorum (strain SN15 / ATCC MYA-4574 / FGSC 10173) TaxID=321614 RepID=A0A7U2HZS4_PHANO|nr:short-chain dehydrogenase/reductase sthC [Parastagonospora nodorum]QRC94636.1 short-chain dehydrogenase/reductase sthC [Parastagonospora nodorum SN15]KAH3928609.1 short-chain dehydrogenase/reductase sthC [Parastagonospora nodorum]KAH3945411.1 short-chain dehydrogenase/reductase sthC [Parastagonospora nodorum]KAH3983593.1 short-chain dehydrogenase/reductase sthC [Parastagonospora nodorum]